MPQQLKEFVGHVYRDICDSPWTAAYWKPGTVYPTTPTQLRSYLRAQNFYIHGNQQRVRIEELVQRCERGLLSYDLYSFEQLRQFAEDRGIWVVSSSNKKDVVQFLERADDSLKFDKILELPAELRNRIYTAYYEALGVLPQKFTQPPLCTVSRQIRSEALPLFYATATFQIRFVHTYTGPRSDPRPPFDGNGFSVTRLTTHTQALSAGLTDAKLAQIKRVAIVLTTSWLSPAPEVWRMDLSERRDFGKSLRVASGNEFGRVWCAKVTRGLEELAKKLVTKTEGTGKLAKGDFEEMRKVVHRGMTKGAGFG